MFYYLRVALSLIFFRIKIISAPFNNKMKNDLCEKSKNKLIYEIIFFPSHTQFYK